VDGDGRLDPSPQRVRQGRVGGPGAGELGGAAIRGTIRAESSEQSDGTALNELSLCQSMLASW
jgi:hypothetical protein